MRIKKKKLRGSPPEKHFESREDLLPLHGSSYWASVPLQIACKSNLCWPHQVRTNPDICYSRLRYYTSVKGYGRWWMWGDDCKGAAWAQINIHQFILETLWKITNHTFYVLCMLYAKCYIHDVCKNATKYFILDINLNYTCSCMHL